MDEGQNVDIKKYDMQFLTTIYNKVQKGYKLTKEELRFLYEIDHKIEGFGYDKDPRIEEIISKRNIKKDLAYIFDCKEEEVCLGGYLPKDKITKVYWGFLLSNRLTSAEALELPEYIRGDLWLNSLTSAKGLDLSNTSIGGSLDLRSLTSAEGLTLPKHIEGNLRLDGLKSAESLDLSNTNIGGYLGLSSLTSAEDLDLTNTNIGGPLYLSGLTSAEDLTLPKHIGGDLWLDGLTSAKGLDLSNTSIGGFLDLRSLTSAKGLDLSNTSIGGDLWLNSLTSVEGLKLPENFDIKKLFAPNYIIEEIKNHPEKYYIQKEAKKLDSPSEEDIQNGEPTKGRHI